MFGNLSPGVYRVEAKLSGFKTAAREQFDVIVYTTARVDLQLEPGRLREVYIKSSEEPAYDSSDRD